MQHIIEAALRNLEASHLTNDKSVPAKTQIIKSLQHIDVSFDETEFSQAIDMIRRFTDKECEHLRYLINHNPQQLDTEITRTIQQHTPPETAH